MAESLARTLAAMHKGISEGLHSGAQMYVSRQSEPVADLAIGEVSTGVAMTTDTLLLWLSAGKPLTAVAIAQLWEQGKLQLDDPVAQHMPPFAAQGKERITIRHLLTHTAGIRPVPSSNWELAPWEQTIEHICQAPPEPEWVPGRKAGYHVASSWFVLGELVRLLSGQAIDSYLREHLLLPLQVQDSWLCLSPEAYAAYGVRIGPVYATHRAPAKPTGWDTAAQAALARPGGSARGPARELGRFYEMLLGQGQRDGRRVLRPQTVEAITARHRAGMFDHTFKHVMDWGLGFLINSGIYNDPAVPYQYGRHASSRTFGHAGAQSSTAFADPEHGLAVAVIFNGLPGEVKHQARMGSVLTALYEDLGLAS